MDRLEHSTVGYILASVALVTVGLMAANGLMNAISIHLAAQKGS